MNTPETKLIRKLIKKYGKDTSLGEVLKLENNINIENVNFKLLGVYKYAYEMTGESFSIEGTMVFQMPDGTIKTEKELIKDSI